MSVLLSVTPGELLKAFVRLFGYYFVILTFFLSFLKSIFDCMTHWNSLESTNLSTTEVIVLEFFPEVYYRLIWSYCYIWSIKFDMDGSKSYSSSLSISTSMSSSWSQFANWSNTLSALFPLFWAFTWTPCFARIWRYIGYLYWILLSVSLKSTSSGFCI